MNVLVGLEILKAGRYWSDEEIDDAFSFDGQVRCALGYDHLGQGEFDLRTVYTYRWDMGFIEKDEYVAKRAALQEQLACNQPIAEQELIQAKIGCRFQETWPSADAAQPKDIPGNLERASLNGRVVEEITMRSAFLHLARQARDLMGRDDARILGIT